MDVQTQNKPPSRAERLGQSEPDQVHIMRPPGSPPTRAERLGKTPKTKYRITFASSFLLIGTALFFDGIEFATTWSGIGILGSYVTWIFGNLTFWTWFTTINVPIGFSSPKKLLVGIVANVIEIIPALDAIPILGMGWTIGVIALVTLTRFEDKTGIKLPTSPQKAVSDKPVKIKGSK